MIEVFEDEVGPLRQAAEDEERQFYTRRAGTEWLAALAPLGTDRRNRSWKPPRP